MLRLGRMLSWILMPGLAAVAGSSPNPTPLLLLSEVRPGGMASEQRCTLVFPDHRYHHETASRRHGRDIDRKVFEGELSEADWNALTGILDRQEFRDLNVPRSVPPLVMPEVHAYTISVDRQGKFQNMEFLTDKSRKPYDPQLKPLLQWWKSFYGRHMSESNSSPDGKCSLDNNDAVFSQ